MFYRLLFLGNDVRVRVEGLKNSSTKMPCSQDFLHSTRAISFTEVD